MIRGRFRIFLVLAGLLCLNACSSERREVKAYLLKFDKASTPVLQEAKVLQALGESLNGTNFMATWPTLRKNIAEMKEKLAGAESDFKGLHTPPAASALQQLALDEIALLNQTCDKSEVVGDKVANLVRGLGFLKGLKEMQPQLEELKALKAQQIEMSKKIEIELTNLKKKEHLL